MTDAPKRIWLQDAGDYAAASLSSEVTWCASPVDEADSSYILATPEALAASPEVAALIAEARREGWNAAIEAAAALAHPPQWERKGKTFTVDESVELKAENERLRTPQGAAKVLLTISDVEIKPAAKALQDAFNLKGIGWKRYLSALRAAITALQETKP